MVEKHVHLSRRERQIMDVLYELKEASAQEVMARLPSPPSYSAVRAMLAKLEQKQHIEHFEIGQRYIYRATVAESKARNHALKNMVKVFFGGSSVDAATALLGMNKKLSDDELNKLQEMIDRARR